MKPMTRRISLLLCMITLLGLMLTACALCLAIIGVMIYWLNNFF